jgi:hypothetical protein
MENLMKNICKQLLLARMPIVCFCLLACCGSVSAGESGNEPQSTEKTGTDTHGDQKKTEDKHEDILDRALSPLDKAVSDINQDVNNKKQPDGKHEDILDRAFSPLDNAVSDINKDMNKGDDESAPVPNK